MARRIRWQIFVAVVSSALVLGLVGYLALTTTAVARPLAGGEYVEALTAPPRHLNPLVSDPSQDPGGADVQALLFEGLMRVGVDGLPEPALAATWPEISSDGTVYTFTLRSGVTWHDGAPLSADDVLFTVRSVQRPGFVGDPLTGGVWRNVVLEKVGENQIRCTLPEPLAPFLSLATFPILPAHLLGDVPPEEWATTSFNQQPIGTGPYRLTTIDGERALLAANRGYYGGRPFLDSIELRFSDDPQENLASLTRGEIGGIGFASTNTLSRVNAPRGTTRRTVPLDAYTTLTFNLRQAPLSDQALRRALALGLDKDLVIERAIGGQAARLDTPILPGWWAADPAVQWYPAAPDRAANALSSLGYELGPDGVRARDGQSLTFELLTDDAPDRLAAAQEIALQWRTLGVIVEVQQVDSATLRQRLDEHDFTMAIHAWQRQGPDPDIALELWHSDGAESGYNYAGLEDERIDELLMAGRATDDFSTRLAAYAEFQRRWIELAPSITLYQPLFVYTTTSELSGLDLDPANDEAAASRPLLLGREDRFRNITGWFLRSAREIRGDLRQSS